ADGPPARYGHTAVYEQGWRWDFHEGDEHMVVFGGRDDSGTPYRTDDTWQLSIPLPGGTPTWTQLPNSGTPRASHVAVFQGAGNDPTMMRRMIVFGGQDASGLRGDVRELRLDGGPTWRTLAPLDDAWPPSGGHPSPRAEVAGIFEVLQGRLVM